jgi:hypothetical protein
MPVLASKKFNNTFPNVYPVSCKTVVFVAKSFLLVVLICSLGSTSYVNARKN